MVKLALMLVAAILYAMGWTAGMIALGSLWCWSAMAVGWDDARRRLTRTP